MDLSFTEDQELIKNSVEKFINDNYAFEKRRKIIAGSKGFDEKIWKSFSELGWLALTFPVKYGGFGGGLIDLMILMKEFGRALVVEPYISTIVMSGNILAFCPESDLRNNILSSIISGNSKVSFAFAELGSRFNPHDVTTSAKKSSSGWEVNGHKTVVFGGGQADYILLSARTSGDRLDKSGISIFCIDAKDRNLEFQDYPTVDGFRAAEIKINGLKLGNNALVSEKDKAVEIIEKTFLTALVATAAEASGIMEKMYEMTLEYISTRKQFGVTIGSFQAIQHRAVEMLILSEEMTSLSSMAALTNDISLSNKKPIYSSKINIGIGGRKLGQEAIQLHGGMGVTEEMEIGQYFKRLTLLDTFLGNADYYLKEYSKMEFN